VSSASALHVRALTLFASLLAGCATLPNADPLTIDVVGIEPVPSEDLELRLAVTIRIQNPNDAPVEYTGAALSLDLNGRNLASGVTPTVGVVPRYGETTFVVPVTISAFDMVRQVFGFAEADARGEVRYRVRGKLEGGLFGSRRFVDEGALQLPQRPAGSGAPAR
jgi:LEA14-like dessication related protein